MKDYSCKICGYCFTTLNTLTAHVAVSHPGKSITFCGCVYCEDASFRDLNDRNVHYAKNHPTAPTWICGECGCGFESRKKIRTHLDRCGTEWTCCGRPYKNEDCLRGHRKIKHPVAICEHCPYQSVSRAHFRNHKCKTTVIMPVVKAEVNVPVFKLSGETIEIEDDPIEIVVHQQGVKRKREDAGPSAGKRMALAYNRKRIDDIVAEQKDIECQVLELRKRREMLDIERGAFEDIVTALSH